MSKKVKNKDKKGQKGHVRTSTIVLIVVFVLSLALYVYLHGTTRVDLFTPEPDTTTVQPIPVIPWEEYQEQMSQENESEPSDAGDAAPSEDASEDQPTTSVEPREPDPEETAGAVP
ncbi:MAG TPA: hypothetical protein GX530_02220 [Corynebacteriales bacterium]|nr:hypothetical protein [Mycobacteriales bacterium]